MEATHADSGNIHDRLSTMKLRISSKKNQAGMLFSGLGEVEPASNEAPESSLLAFKKRQEDANNPDGKVLH